MKESDIKIAKFRLNMVLDSLRFQNSSADVHTVNNIRNTATMLLSQLETDPHCFKDELIWQIVKNTETATTAFFREKFLDIR